MTTPSKTKLKQTHSYLLTFYFLDEKGGTGFDRIDVSCKGPASVADISAWEQQVKEHLGHLKVTTLNLIPLVEKPAATE